MNLVIHTVSQKNKGSPYNITARMIEDAINRAVRESVAVFRERVEEIFQARVDAISATIRDRPSPLCERPFKAALKAYLDKNRTNWEGIRPDLAALKEQGA